MDFEVGERTATAHGFSKVSIDEKLIKGLLSDRPGVQQRSCNLNNENGNE